MKMKRIPFFITVAALFLGATMVCYAPPVTVTSRVLTPYITTLTAATQGAINGTDALPGGGNPGIKLASIQHNVSVPLDSTGQAVGNRKHGLFTVVKQLDANTPKLYKALVNNENITTMVVRFYGTLSTSGGNTVPIFTYTLTNARVAAIRNWQPNANDPAAAPYVHPEEVSFAYQSITWHDDVTGVESTDSLNVTP